MRTLTPNRSILIFRNIRMILLIDFLIRKGKSKHDAFFIAATSESLSIGSAYRIYNDRYRYNVPNQQ